MRAAGVVVFAMSVTAWVAGCAGLLDSEEPAERVYWLDPYVLSAPGVAAGDKTSLSIGVSAAPGLDTDRLLILEPDSRLNHYASARWPDNIPDVIQSHFQATLESSGRFSRVSAGPTSRAADKRLQLEVREIYTVVNLPGEVPVVRVVLGGYVTCSETDALITLAADANVDSNQLSYIVAAYQAALNQVSQQLVGQLDESCTNELQR